MRGGISAASVQAYLLNDTPNLAQPSLALLQACADRHLLGPAGNATLAALLVKPLQHN